MLVSTPLDPTPSYDASSQPSGEVEQHTPSIDQSPPQATAGNSAAVVYPPYPPYPAAPTNPYPYAYPSSPYPGAPAYAPAPPPGTQYPVYYVPVAAPVGPTPGKRRRPGYLIAGIGAAIALFAYFSLPLFTITLKISDSTLGLNQSSSQAATASQVAAVPLGSGFSLTSFFVLIPAVGIIALLAAIAVPATALTASRGIHILAAITCQIGAVLSAAILVVGTLQFKDQYDQLINGIFGGSASALDGINYSVDMAYGLYVIVGGLALILIGGILVLARGDRAAPFPAPMPPAAR